MKKIWLDLWEYGVIYAAMVIGLIMGIMAGWLIRKEYEKWERNRKYFDFEDEEINNPK